MKNAPRPPEGGQTRNLRFALAAFVFWLAATLGWWIMAFAPLSEVPPWLASVRSVCFGSLPTGLPDAYGWISLMSPLTMLGFLLVVWGRELFADLRWLAASAAGRAALVAIVGVPLVGALWVGRLVAREIEVKASFTSPIRALETLPEGYPRTDRPASDFRLVDQAGETLTLESLRGRPVLLTFAYAHCQTICPVIVRTVSWAAERLGDLQPAVVVVTLDPWRDTPSSLPALAESWDLGELARGHVLSGEVADVQAVLEAYEVPSDRDLKTGEIFHPALVYLLDSDGTIAYTFNNPSAEWLVDASRRVSRPRSPTLRPTAPG